RASALRRWIEQAEQNQSDLEKLLAEVRDYKISESTGQHDSNVDYDRRRMTKESLLERVIATSVELADTARVLRAAVAILHDCSTPSDPSDERQLTIAVFAALLRQDASAARDAVGRR